MVIRATADRVGSVLYTHKARENMMMHACDALQCEARLQSHGGEAGGCGGLETRRVLTRMIGLSLLPAKV